MTLTKTEFNAYWKQLNAAQRRATVAVVERHMVTGQSVNKVVNSVYAKDSKDFKFAIATMSKAYAKYKF